jgi:hypothetical protein
MIGSCVGNPLQNEKILAYRDDPQFLNGVFGPE